MARLSFVKMQGLGNDFILAEGKDLSGLSAQELSALAQRLCDRHFGIGADGLVLNWPSDQGVARMQILNSDGSEPEMCGNGLRCFARYLQLQGSQFNEWQIETGAGLLKAETRHSQQAPIRVNMGKPILHPDNIPARHFTGEQVIDERLICEGQNFIVTLVSMGNPHCVIRVPDFESLDFEYWGPRLERHPAFPARANIEFVVVDAAHHARVKVWERGVGATLACGTGACAVLVAGVLGGWLDIKAQISLPGGELQITWPEPDGPVWMEGPAELVYRGEIELEAQHG